MISRRSDFTCPSCGLVREDQAPVCPRCAVAYQERVSIQTGDSASMTDSEEVVGEESRPDLEAVVFKSFEGMRSHSTLGESRVELTLQGPLDLGKKSEGRVADRIISVLKSEGRVVEVIPHEDARGEDRKIRCDGTEVDVQVVTVPPAPPFLREASQGSAATSVSIEQAAAWINDSVSAKAAHYSAAQRAATLLALDARHVSVLASARELLNPLNCSTATLAAPTASAQCGLSDLSTVAARSFHRPSGSDSAAKHALEADGARRLWSESFFSAPQLKRIPLGGNMRTRQ